MRLCVCLSDESFRVERAVCLVCANHWDVCACVFGRSVRADAGIKSSGKVTLGYMGWGDFSFNQ